MKYIVFTHATKGDMLFTFSREIDHDRMAEAVTAVRFGDGRNWNREFFRATPISAGFIDNGKCHGHSETLNLKSRGDADTKLLAAAVLQQEAGEPVAWQFSASFWSRYESIPETLRADARPLYAAPQVSPPQARVPLTEVQQREAFETRARKSGYSLRRDGDEYCHPPTQHAWQGWMMCAHLIGLETKE